MTRVSNFPGFWVYIEARHKFNDSGRLCTGITIENSGSLFLPIGSHLSLYVKFVYLSNSLLMQFVLNQRFHDVYAVTQRFPERYLMGFRPVMRWYGYLCNPLFPDQQLNQDVRIEAVAVRAPGERDVPEGTAAVRPAPRVVFRQPEVQHFVLDERKELVPHILPQRHASFHWFSQHP